MSSVCLKLIKISFLLATLMFAVTGCGSSGSKVSNETGSIAAKLTWNSPEAKSTGKTLYAAPAEVTTITVSVYYDNSSTNSNNLITSKTFDASLGSGTLEGIPAGDGRAVKVEGSGFHAGLGVSGVLLYLGTKTVNVVAGPTPTPVTITMEAPVTSASPATAPPAASFPVTLTANVPATIYYTTSQAATIYYTTNGDTPNIFSSPRGTSPVNFSVTPPARVRFFAEVQGLYEAIREKLY